MKLINPTDDELNAAFAERVCGLKVKRGKYYHDHPPTGRWYMGGSGPGIEYPDDGLGGGFQKCIEYTKSLDAVMPWLEENVAYCIHRCSQWEVTIHCGYRGNKKTPFAHRIDYEYRDKSLPRAAVIALLRANGVEITYGDTAIARI